MRLRWVRDGAIVLGVGLIIAALGAECLAAFNAGGAAAAAYRASGRVPYREVFTILVVGVGFSSAGAVPPVLRFRGNARGLAVGYGMLTVIVHPMAGQPSIIPPAARTTRRLP
jgi:hypothetical protein